MIDGLWTAYGDATVLQAERPVNLASGVTADADFIGDSVLAKDLAKRLGWQVWIPALEDSTPQTGKVTRRMKSGEVKQVDLLSGLSVSTPKTSLAARSRWKCRTSVT